MPRWKSAKARIYVEAVHRLSNLGAVVTRGGTSREGFEAEWREPHLTVDGDLINRSELFDEADLDAALARFEELTQPAPRLENAASRVDERFLAFFAARDWDAMAGIGRRLFRDDRRRVVNAGRTVGTSIAKLRHVAASASNA